jgi:hypothetical protein
MKKTCVVCKKEKEASLKFFYKYAWTDDGLGEPCKTCVDKVVKFKD